MPILKPRRKLTSKDTGKMESHYFNILNTAGGAGVVLEDVFQVVHLHESSWIYSIFIVYKAHFYPALALWLIFR